MKVIKYFLTSTVNVCTKYEVSTFLIRYLFICFFFLNIKIILKFWRQVFVSGKDFCDPLPLIIRHCTGFWFLPPVIHECWISLVIFYAKRSELERTDSNGFRGEMKRNRVPALVRVISLNR